MTVKELIAELQKFNEDAPVKFADKTGEIPLLSLYQVEPPSSIGDSVEVWFDVGEDRTDAEVGALLG